MEKQEMNREEWCNTANWHGPKLLSVYVSRRDSRLWVPKQVSSMGWTMNLGHRRALVGLGLIGLAVILLPVVIIMSIRRSALISAAEPWLWLATSLSLAIAAVFPNGLCRYRLSWVFVGMTFGFFAALTGFGIQGLFNGPVVTLLGAANLTWHSHLYLALAGAAAQTFGKCLFVPLGWKVLRAAGLSDKVRVGLLVGLGFTVLEICLLWSQAVWAQTSFADWRIGALERGVSSVFHIYATGLLAMGLARRQYSLFALVIAVHFLTDWFVGANATLLHLTAIQMELWFAAAAAIIWVTFLVVTRKVVGELPSAA